jgi:cytoplasmic FMR1 interacting protein
MSDALSNVEVLYELPLIDSQPSVEGANNAIVYEANFDTNFEDKAAYITGISKYIEEAVLHSNLVRRTIEYIVLVICLTCIQSLLLEQGYQHAMTLYTWRCCSRAIPTVSIELVAFNRLFKFDLCFIT